MFIPRKFKMTREVFYTLTLITFSLFMAACGGASGGDDFIPDGSPSDINGSNKLNVALQTPVIFDPVTVEGINVGVPISITGGYYRINSGSYTNNSGVLHNNDVVTISHISSANELTDTNTIVTVSDINVTFTSTTATKDSSPVDFSFTSQVGVMRHALIESERVLITGINTPTSISVTGGYYRVNDGTYSDYNTTIVNGDVIQVRYLSSNDYNTTISSTTLTIGNKSAVFLTTTLEENTTIVDAVNVKDYSVSGDGVTDDSNALNAVLLIAKTEGKNLYFPAGTYLADNFVNAQGVRLIGEDQNTTSIKCNSGTKEQLDTKHNIEGAENITFENCKIGDYATSTHRLFKNSSFRMKNISNDIDMSNYYFIQTGISNTRENVDDEFVGCNFSFDNLYVGLYITNYNSVSIRDCSFDGNATHMVFLKDAYNRRAQVSILGNKVTGGKTGIFIGSDRVFPIEGGLIEGNELSEQWEEGIGLDGFGNSPGRVPVIANGPLSAIWNDADGRVVVSMNEMVYMNDALSASPSPVSLHDDWTNFYFTFGEGSGLEGTMTKIESFNAAENTLTLSLKLPSYMITTGGDAGVQAGFYNWIVRGNTLTDILGTADENFTYGTAISIYLNVFGTLVEDNYVSYSAHGLNVAGGLMENVVRTLAYKNIVRNNTFYNCDLYRYNGITEPSERYGAVRFNSTYGGPLQYGNKFIGNSVYNDVNESESRMFFQQQADLNDIQNDNNLSNVNLLIKPLIENF